MQKPILMRMRFFTTLLILLTGYTASFAQFSVSGKVNDEKQKPADGATVLLLKPADSSLVKSALTGPDGKYVFNAVASGKYYLSVSMLGYKKTYTPITVAGADVKADDIQLAGRATEMNEISVVAKKPFLEQHADKLVVNIESSATAAGSTAMEVLQKVPGIMVSNDKLTMIGKGTPAILVDGRASQYTDVSQLLRDISAANIEKIEVISNPGAKYDAAGGAVINIILKRNVNMGTNGSFTMTSGMGLYDRKTDKVDRDFYRVSPSISLNHRKGKVNTYGGYSYFYRNQYDYSEFNRLIDANRFSQENYSPNKGGSHSFRLGSDYYADKKNTFGVMFSGFTREGDRDANNSTRQLRADNDQLLSTFQTINSTASSRRNFSGNLNWKHSFDTTGTDLNIDASYSKFKINNDGVITNRLSNGSSYINNQLVDNPVKFGVLKLDYGRPFSQATKLEAGAKVSMATIDNYLTFIQNGVPDADRSTDFRYQENINAAYASIRHTFNGWEIQGGLRAEQTVAKGKSKSEEVLDRDYIQLFPSAFLKRDLNKKMATVLQYSRRVNRPSYQQQNPFIEYLDSLTYTRGNPLLKPETADEYKVSLTYESQPFISFSYNKKRDIIFENAPRQDGNLTYTTSENLASYENFAAELNFPIQFGSKVTGYGGNQMIYNRYNAEYLGGTYDKGKWNWLAYWQVSYKPSANWNFEVSGYYMSPFLEEFITIGRRGSLNAGIQKTFWEKRGRLVLNCNDILYSDKTKGHLAYREINLNFNQRYETRNARLTFSYSFGNQKLKAARNRSTGTEDEAGRVKTN